MSCRDAAVTDARLSPRQAIPLDPSSTDQPGNASAARFGPRWQALVAIVAAFGAYFCMGAFRKPFTAATFEGQTVGQTGYKSILISSQLVGYTLSKFIGISWISAWPQRYRNLGILGCISIAQLALLGFAMTPPPFGAIFLFINGFPLGLVFGLVLASLEGRQLTEAMVAGLCVSFIVSSGVVKSIGRMLISEYQISESWMPATTGFLFVIPTFFFIWLLTQIGQPSETDRRLRHARTPMTARKRKELFSKHRTGITALVSVFLLLTVIRSFRDDFAVEIWQGLGVRGQPGIYAWSETAVMLGVIAINGAAVRIVDNRKAFLWSLTLVKSGLLLALASLFALKAVSLPPFPFMVLLGLGLYVPYVAFHTTVFERLLAANREPGNIGFLMYLADFSGYFAYIGFLLTKPWIEGAGQHLSTFITATAVLSLLALGLSMIATGHYRQAFRGTDSPSP